MVEASSAWGVYRSFRNGAVYHAAPSKRKSRVLLSIAAKLRRGRELQFRLRVNSLLARLLRHEIASFANRYYFRRWNGPAVLLPGQRLKRSRYDAACVFADDRRGAISYFFAADVSARRCSVATRSIRGTVRSTTTEYSLSAAAGVTLPSMRSRSSASKLRSFGSR